MRLGEQMACGLFTLHRVYRRWGWVPKLAHEGPKTQQEIRHLRTRLLKILAAAKFLPCGCHLSTPARPVLWPPAERSTPQPT